MTDNVVNLFGNKDVVNKEKKKQRFAVVPYEHMFYISDSLYPDLVYTDKEKCVFSQSEQSLNSIALALNERG
jgi:hypothetical protein